MAENVTGTNAWNPAITYIIRQALLNVSAIDENEEPGATLYEDGLFKLNALVKQWQAMSIHVWTEEEAILFLQPGQQRYLLGGTTTDHCVPAFEYALGEVLTPSAQGDFTVTLEDTLGFADNNVIGVVLDSGVTQWTTINGAPVAGVVTLDDALLGSVSAQNLCYTYAPGIEIQRPLEIPRARTLQWNGLIENPMTELSRQEYMDLPNKFSPGSPTQWFYTPLRSQGQFFPWNLPNSAAWAIRFTWYREIFDLDNPANTVDFPQEWVNALLWNLARELAPSYDVPNDRWLKIKDMAATTLAMVQGFDNESEDVQFGVDYGDR